MSPSELHRNKTIFLYRKRIRIYDGEEIETLRNATLGHTFNGGVLTPIENDLYFNNDPEKSYTFKFLTRPLAVIPVVTYFRKNSYLVEVFDEKLEKFESSGLISYWTNLYTKRKYSKAPDSSGPKQLTVETILGSLQLLFFGWVVAFTAFVAELIHFKSKEFRNYFSNFQGN